MRAQIMTRMSVALILLVSGVMAPRVSLAGPYTEGVASSAAFMETGRPSQDAAADSVEGGGAVILQDTELDARTRELAAQLRCPVCQGLSIQDSPTEMAEDMKLLIREQLAEGRSAEEVREFFIGRYGEWVLLEPEARGLNLAVYILPAIGLIFGVGLIIRSVQRWVRHGEPSTDPAAH